MTTFVPGGGVPVNVGGFFGGQRREPRAGIHFHPINPAESAELMGAANPAYYSFECGHCGRSTNGRVLCRLTDETESNDAIAWCICACERQLPTVLINKDDGTVVQHPEHCEFKPGKDWPQDLTKLFEEAAKSYGASAHTASTMVCRKILMACACEHGAEEGLSFAAYVKYILQHVLPLPKAADSIDRIRKIGNDANHKIEFVTRDGARQALVIVNYLLNAVYSLPEASAEQSGIQTGDLTQGSAPAT